MQAALKIKVDGSVPSNHRENLDLIWNELNDGAIATTVQHKAVEDVVPVKADSGNNQPAGWLSNTSIRGL